MRFEKNRMFFTDCSSYSHLRLSLWRDTWCRTQGRWALLVTIETQGGETYDSRGKTDFGNRPFPIIRTVDTIDDRTKCHP